jgi:hypothetical protein
MRWCETQALRTHFLAAFASNAIFNFPTLVEPAKPPPSTPIFGRLSLFITSFLSF